MSVYCDSSALVKRYSDEEHAAAVRSLDDIVVSELTRVEVPAAIWRKHRMGELDGGDAAVLTSAFEHDWYGDERGTAAFAVVAVSDAILERAARHAAAHGLRGYEAVQLATAVAARGADPDLDTFACFDRRLRDAAAVEGFRLLAA
jgi:hypothetical protein